MPLRITPSVAEQEGQQTETEATGAPQKHHYTLNQQVGSITRSRGYAVIEFTKDGKPQSALANSGTTLGYVVNTVAPNLYQVTTYVGGVTLSRGFALATDGKAYPAGPWTREE
nr:hypothetical protein [Klebsiella pneumoniae]